MEDRSHSQEAAQQGSEPWKCFLEPLVLTTVHCLPHSNPCVEHTAGPHPSSSLNALRVAAPSGLQLILARN